MKVASNLVGAVLYAACSRQRYTIVAAWLERSNRDSQEHRVVVLIVKPDGSMGRLPLPYPNFILELP